MMNKYVVRQPIKDIQGNLFGYEILFQEEKGSGFSIIKQMIMQQQTPFPIFCHKIIKRYLMIKSLL